MTFGGWTAGLVAFFVAVPISAGTTVHLVSWNVHGPVFNHQRIERMHAVADAVASRHPDFILFQEVWLRGDAALLAHVFEPLGYVRVETKSRWPHRVSGLLIFVDGKRWIVDGEHHEKYRQHAAWWRLNEGDGFGQKGILAADVHDVTSGQRLTIVATHTQSPYARSDLHEIRRQQVRQLVAYTRTIDAGRPAIIAGDFNTAPEGPEDGPIYRDEMLAAWTDLTLQARIDCLHEHDPSRIEPRACGTHFDDNGRLSNEWIDYVFTRRSDAVHAATVRLIRNESSDQPFSDHEGIDAELVLP